MDGLIYEPFDQMEVVAFCIPGSPLADQTLSLKKLAEQPLVLRKGGRIESVLMSQGYKTNFALRCEASQAVKVAVQTGIGIGITYRNAIATRLGNGGLKIINVPELKALGIKSYIVHDGRRPLSPIAGEFLELLRQMKQTGSKDSGQAVAGTSGSGRQSRRIKKPQAVVAKSSRKHPLPPLPSIA
jgi:DNA-binding transcriptional LysR family regulator